MSFADDVKMERLWICQWCLKDHSQETQRDWLHVHHILRRKTHPHLKYDRNNLLVLCQRCHNKAERMPPDIQRWLTVEFETKGFNEKLMSFNYGKLNTGSGGGSGDRSPLPAGKYISNPKPKDKAEVQGESLSLLKLLAPKTLKDGATRHSFLVGSDWVQGTGFLKIDLQDYYLTPEACALAFGKKPKNGSQFHVDPADMADLSSAHLEAIQNRITDDATSKVIAANTPPEVQADAIETAIHNTLLQIQINVGTIFRLQDWAGIERNPQGDLGLLEQTVFEGAVKASSLPGGAPEISVYSLPKDKAPQKSVATQFSEGAVKE